MADVQSEINYWSSATYCYVVAANPPIHVMDGYIHRIWTDHGVEKIAMVLKGYICCAISFNGEKRFNVEKSCSIFLTRNLSLSMFGIHIDKCRELGTSSR